MNNETKACIGIGYASVATGCKCSCGVDKNGKKLWCFLHNKRGDLDEQ